MTPHDSIIARIQKVMALQARAATEGEAAAAAARIQDMLTEHNLTMAQIDRGAPVTSAGPKRVRTTHRKAAMYEYQKRLMCAIAEVSFCYYTRGNEWREDKKASTGRRFVKTHVLIGREENVMSAQILYDYLTDTMDRLLPWQGMAKRGKDALAWLDGCSERLCDRLYDRRNAQVRERERAAAANTEQGLVLLSDTFTGEQDDNLDFLYGRPVGTTRSQKAAQMAERDRLRAVEQDLIAKGANPEDVWYLARGYDVPARTPDTPVVTETEAERRRREEREARERARHQERWHKRMQAEQARRDNPAFRQGESAGQTIGLDQQVSDADHPSRRRLS